MKLFSNILSTNSEKRITEIFLDFRKQVYKKKEWKKRVDLLVNEY